MSPSVQILLIGAGELGTAFLPHLSGLPNTHVTIGIRTPTRYQHLSSPNISLTALDLSSSSKALSRSFANYDIVISATGFGQSPNVLTKLAREILAAGVLRRRADKGKLWFFPWQWGVNYDITGDGMGLMPLFGEQADIRNILRTEAEESNVRWTIVSTGIFMSFLFEQFWAVVDASSPDETVVRALKSWDHKITVTDVADIGKVLARVIAGDVQAENKIVYAAGDTVSYKELADIIERIVGKDIKREEWTVPHLEAELAKDPNDVIKKYRLVFARDGVWWSKEGTVNHILEMPMVNVETYAQKLFAA